MTHFPPALLSGNFVKEWPLKNDAPLSLQPFYNHQTNDGMIYFIKLNDFLTILLLKGGNISSPRVIPKTWPWSRDLLWSKECGEIEMGFLCYDSFSAHSTHMKVTDLLALSVLLLWS